MLGGWKVATRFFTCRSPGPQVYRHLPAIHVDREVRNFLRVVERENSTGRYERKLRFVWLSVRKRLRIGIMTKGKPWLLVLSGIELRLGYRSNGGFLWRAIV